jgi:predicted nucleotidyltransferase
MVELIKEITKLRLPKDKFAVFGSGPLMIRGIRDANDIDIIVKKSLWTELVWTHPSKKNAIQLGKIVEVYKDWVPIWDNNPGIDILIDTADVIEGVRFVKLEHVLSWKTARGQEKDLKDIKLIEDYLASGKA